MTSKRYFNLIAFSLLLVMLVFALNNISSHLSTTNMAFILQFITWDFDPTMINLFGLDIRWYGLMFAFAFIVGHFILQWVYKIEGKPQQDMDLLTITIILSTVIGARLGHIIFYDPQYYFFDLFEQYQQAQSLTQNLPNAPQTAFEALWRTFIRIINIREGGLASHGATIGIITGILIFARKRPDQSFSWTADRLSLTIAIGAVFIRLGNFFNSEICGYPTDLPWAIQYIQASGSDCAGPPRHPTQMYEALSYLLIFITIITIYNKLRQRTPRGLIVGVLLSALFTARFCIEFVKEDQESYNNPLWFNTGQLLSIPLVIMGIILLYRALKNPTPPAQIPVQTTSPTSGEE